MACTKNKELGEMRLLFIHSRMEYLCLQELDDENMDELKYKPLCDYCEMKLDMSGGKEVMKYKLPQTAKHFLCSVVVWAGYAELGRG